MTSRLTRRFTPDPVWCTLFCNPHNRTVPNVLGKKTKQSVSIHRIEHTIIMDFSRRTNDHSPALPSSPTLPAAMDPFAACSESPSTPNRLAALASAALTTADASRSSSSVDIMSSSSSAAETVTLHPDAALDISITVDARAAVDTGDIVYCNDVVDDILDDYTTADKRSAVEGEDEVLAEGNNGVDGFVTVNDSANDGAIAGVHGDRRASAHVVAVNDPVVVSVAAIAAAAQDNVGVADAVSCDGAVAVDGNGTVLDDKGNNNIPAALTPTEQAWAIYKACLEGPCRLSEVLEDETMMSMVGNLRVPPVHGEPLLNLVMRAPTRDFKNQSKLAVFHYLYLLVDRPFACDNSGQTVLHILANRSGVEDRRILRYLINQADWNVLDLCDKSGDTALMVAVTSGDFHNAGMLMRAGANPGMTGH
ncbi:hypothetical protein M406DRAFT_108647 [Cryphonectria parasitica EP155]|uniref:Ankyrin repeat protein n=1 Tax=Cryphonectria parasitica (strain ATCC 38755 / EP155) TaxID=660469 RepID=A0A9P5CMR8_CRYP1|nr:uncharacterized protein M406DRAFT_108647 [Cryphonectria parasitica EP155]KAF3763547.1 hypothetical protein M406DRAFT_108647 [Cryphonectria parasitica EP155]